VSDHADDDLNELRRLRDEALGHRFDDALVDAYHRGSIGMAWREVADAESIEPPPVLMDTFRVEVLGLPSVPSALAGLIASGVQRATTQMDSALLRPQSAALRPSREDRDDTLVIQEGAAGNTLIFRAPAAVLREDGIDFGVHPNRAGRALQQLMNVLPENPEDIGSFIRGIGSAPVLERQAVQTMSRLALNSPFGLGLNLENPRVSVRSNFNKQSAEQVDDYLRDRQVNTSTEERTGILDGFRGTRRVFYLITEDGREIAGSVDDALLPTVRRLAGQRVLAHLAATQWAARSGSLGPKHYDLLKIEPEPEDPALFPRADDE
jgi:predicted phosphoribosyltransferase